MHRQMCWLSKSGGDGEKTLYLQTEPNQPWRPYTAFGHLAVPDYQIPGGSKGWATYQKLLKAGWTLVPSARANEFGSSSYAESTTQINKGIGHWLFSHHSLLPTLC